MGLSHTLVEQPSTTIESELAQLRRGGVRWVREDLSWALVQPNQGVFNWAPLDRFMTAAARSDVHVLGILDYSAPWASSDPAGAGNQFYPPADDADFADFASAVARRYGTDGTFWTANPSLPKLPLSAVEIWNEPYGSTYWKPNPSASAYAALVRASAPAIHAADPDMKVLMSGELQSVSWSGARGPWLSSLLRADPGLPSLVNAFDIHPYPAAQELGPFGVEEGPETAFERVELVHQMLQSAGYATPIWITEVGWSTAPGLPYTVSEATQAKYLVQAVERGIGEWGSFVPYVFLFSWDRANGIAGDSGHNYGVLSAQGEPRTAWRAIASLLGGKTV